jgi:N-acetylglucosaminyldiphosphoundecaprenol N-acetyl-beta-D-mannosaminyltransferase
MTTQIGDEYRGVSPDIPNSLKTRCQEAKRNFLEIDLSVITRASLLEIFRESLQARRPLTISFLNPNIVTYAHRNPSIIPFMNGFDVMLPDGIGVVWGARVLGMPLSERLGNDDIGADIFRICAKEGYSNFLFGSRPGVAERAAVNLERSFPSLRISGTLHGFWFGDPAESKWCKSEDNKAILKQINSSHSDVLWVGLSTPLQQRWVHENRDRINSCVVITSGGYLDHLAERVNWYPAFFNKLHLSWLYRLLREPRRLWRRYSIELLEFMWLLLSSKFTFRRKRIDHDL